MKVRTSVRHALRPADRQRRTRTLISLTPLIDVVFILLIFFMLASSFLDWRAIELDASARSAAGSSMEGALLVDVEAQGVRLSGRALTLDQLTRRVRERMASRPDQRVLVQAAQGVSVQRAVDVLDRLTGAGVKNLSLVRAPGASGGA